MRPDEAKGPVRQGGQDRQTAILDFWNSFAKHDSVFQKSLLLAQAVRRHPWKTRCYCERGVPKMLEFAPHGESSKNTLGDRTQDTGDRGWNVVPIFSEGDRQL
jgi:hypothetical protein